eukprot:3055937-Pyramimonas_sp.AAC.1
MADSVAKQFIDYLQNCSHVSKSLDKFMEENCHLFAVGGEEQKMSYMSLYQEYNTLVEQVPPNPHGVIDAGSRTHPRTGRPKARWNESRPKTPIQSLSMSRAAKILFTCIPNTLDRSLPS